MKVGITLQDFSTLLSKVGEFDSQPAIAIAVSGGPDSMALVLLANEWAKNNQTTAIALTVDHQLRSESSKECIMVHEWLKARNIEHHILVWDHEESTPRTGIQAKAREARYHLLQQWCLDHDVATLMTAHHAGDQIETFMQRLSKGSGLRGLCGIRPIIHRPFGKIIRPLLTTTPQDLKKTLDAFGQSYIVDPSNENLDFNRVKWRKLMPQLYDLGLNQTSIIETIDRFSETQSYIDFLVGKAFKNVVSPDPLGFSRLDSEKFQFLNPLIAKEILSLSLLYLGGHPYALKRKSLLMLYESILAGKTITMGGCYLLKKGSEIWILREFSAIHDAQLIDCNGIYSWDNRFLIKVDLPQDFLLQGYSIESVGEKGSRQLRSEKHGLDLPHEAILTTLPGIWFKKKLIAIPSLRLITKENQDNFSKLSFTSKAILFDI